jgi:tRNA dimethylallyltransferase
VLRPLTIYFSPLKIHDFPRYLPQMPDLKKNKKLIVVAGPTAVGKTATAIKLARHFKSDIVSADSRQFFREMNIGTAKPDAGELNTVPHHFVNNLSISEEYDAAQYGDDALECIHSLFKKSDFVILCGGSGLYIRALLEGFDDIPEIPALIRDELVAGYETHGLPWLQERMREEDPEYLERIDDQNPHRLIRALEVKRGTGHSLSWFHGKQKRHHDFIVVKIGLELPREVLYQRIDSRMDRMILDGLVEEARLLYAYRDRQPLQTVGYQEIFDFLDGLYDEEEMVRLLKRNSRRYAKRQLTWFKRDPDMKWFSPEDVDGMIRYIEESGHPGIKYETKF